MLKQYNTYYIPRMTKNKYIRRVKNGVLSEKKKYPGDTETR